MNRYDENKMLLARLLVAGGALKFGDFTLKSGLPSPYFIDFGEINDGPGLNALGRCFANKVFTLYEAGKIRQPDYLFGPAYKGISMATATAMQLANPYGIKVCYGSARKEEKKHGERARFIGAKPKNSSRILILDDVFTTGETKEEAVADIYSEAPEAGIEGVIIGVDRCETDKDGSTAAEKFLRKHKIQTFSILTIYEFIDITYKLSMLSDENKERIEGHLAKYGIKAN